MGIIVGKKHQYTPIAIDPEDFSSINIDSYTEKYGVQSRSVFSHQKHWTRMFAADQRGRDVAPRNGEEI